MLAAAAASDKVNEETAFLCFMMDAQSGWMHFASAISFK
jgi:hypothetical protein